MFHKRKERKDCRGSFWRRSLSFLLVLLLMAGCVQVVGNQAEAAANVREQEAEIDAESQPEQGNSLETGSSIGTDFRDTGWNGNTAFRDGAWNGNGE